MFASYRLYDKSFYIDGNHISFGKKNSSFFSKKNQIWYLLRNLTTSVAFYGLRKYSNSEPDTGVKSDIINRRKCEKMFTFSVSSGPFSFHIYILAENNKSLSESKNQDGQHLNVSPTMPETKTNSARRGLANSH